MFIDVKQSGNTTRLGRVLRPHGEARSIRRAMLSEREITSTVCFLRRLRRKEGGYAADAAHTTAALEDTLSVLKAFRALQAGDDDPAATLEFVHSCFDSATGDFSQRAQGTPSVFSTAQGLIALQELRDSAGLNRWVQRALAFMRAHAASAADHFMLIAAHEECGLLPPFPPESVAFFRALRRNDGTFDENSVLANAMACISLLRAHELSNGIEPVLKLLLAAQQPDGGFADTNGRSDLMTTYTVMRALILLDTPPALDRLSEYICSLRHPDGGYGAGPAAISSAGATYQAVTILRWIDVSWKRPTVPASTGVALSPDDIAGPVEAARRGDLAALTKWLEAGGDPDQPDGESWTPLLAGAVRGQAEVVKLLLHHEIPGARRASPDVRFAPADALPIYMAGHSGDLETVKALLRTRPNHLFEVCGVNGHTVLLQTAFFGSCKHEEIARYLLENVAEILCLPERDGQAVESVRKQLMVATNVRGYNALGVAQLWGNKAMEALFQPYDHTTEQEQDAYLRALLQKVAPAPEPRNKREKRAQALTDQVVTAIEDGFKRMQATPAAGAKTLARDILSQIKGLIESSNFEINRLGGPLRQPPLVVAATGEDANRQVAKLREEIATLLLDHNADPDLEEEHPMGVDAVIRAAVLNHLYLLKLYARYMTPDKLAAAMNRKPPVNGLTTLHDSVHRALTAKSGTLDYHLEQIRWMVAHGARHDIEDNTGRTQEQLAREALHDPNFRENASATLAALGVAT